MIHSLILGTLKIYPSRVFIIPFSVFNNKLLVSSVKSPIDGKPMDGIPSIRVHNGINFVGTSSRFIRWTEVFIIKASKFV